MPQTPMLANQKINIDMIKESLDTFEENHNP